MISLRKKKKKKIILFSNLLSISLSSCATIEEKTNIKLQKDCTEVQKIKTLADLVCKK